VQIFGFAVDSGREEVGVVHSGPAMAVAARDAMMMRDFMIEQ
jgi:hypothetical protein